MTMSNRATRFAQLLGPLGKGLGENQLSMLEIMCDRGLAGLQIMSREERILASLVRRELAAETGIRSWDVAPCREAVSAYRQLEAETRTIKALNAWARAMRQAPTRRERLQSLMNKKERLSRIMGELDTAIWRLCEALGTEPPTPGYERQRDY